MINLIQNNAINADSTHPDIAALVTPFSTSRIEGFSFSLILFSTLFAAKPQRGWSSEA
jgi:hypothetical protein